MDGLGKTGEKWPLEVVVDGVEHHAKDLLLAGGDEIGQCDDRRLATLHGLW